MNIPDNFSDSFETVFGVKILKLFDMEPDPGFGIRSLFDPGSGIWDGKIQIRDKHPGSAILLPATVIRTRCQLVQIWGWR
jgi:hypothetical protein